MFLLFCETNTQTGEMTAGKFSLSCDLMEGSQDFKVCAMSLQEAATLFGASINYFVHCSDYIQHHLIEKT